MSADKIKEYQKNYRQSHPDYHKKYYEAHKDKMKHQIVEKASEKVLCECGKYVRRGYINYHKERNLHQKLLAKKNLVEENVEENLSENF